MSQNVMHLANRTALFSRHVHLAPPCLFTILLSFGPPYSRDGKRRRRLDCCVPAARSPSSPNWLGPDYLKACLSGPYYIGDRKSRPTVVPVLFSEAASTRNFNCRLHSFQNAEPITGGVVCDRNSRLAPPRSQAYRYLDPLKRPDWLHQPQVEIFSIFVPSPTTD